MERAPEKVPLTSRERTRKCRDKQRLNLVKHDALKNIDRIRKSLERKKEMTLKEKEKHREYEKLRKRAQRAQKKKKSVSTEVLVHEGEVEEASSEAICLTSPSPSQKLPYQTASSLGKAVSRTIRAMPNSPTKQAHILAKIALEFTPKKRRLVADIIKPPKRLNLTDERKERSDALSAEQVAEVSSFYLRDDITRMCPGRKDCVTVKTPNGKEKRQKRYLIMNLKEAHEIFTQDAEFSIGISKFSELRPQHVFLTSLRDQDVCMCKYHENLDLLTEGLKKVINNFPHTAEDVVAMTVCSMEIEACVRRECDLCSMDNLANLFEGNDLTEPCPYYQWKTGESGIIEKALIQSDLSSAKHNLLNQLKPFSCHVYDARRQHRELRQLKEQLLPGEVIVHEDFSENYSIRQQREIMPAHWATNGVTIFTVMVYYRATIGEKIQFISYAIVSDELCHDKKSVYSYNKWVLENIKTKLENPILKVHHWSDGVASQFKNKYNFQNLLYHQLDFGVTADWSFFATAHGKGPIDGIGGEVKRQVWRSVLQGKDVVVNAKDFADVAARLCRKIQIVFRSKQDIETDTTHLPLRWASCQPLQGTQSFHFIKPMDRHTLAYGRNSVFTQPDAVLLTKAMTAEGEIPPENEENIEEINDNPTTFNTGDFIVARLESTRSVADFVAQITDIKDEVIYVSFLRASGITGTVFVYPAVEDRSIIQSEEIIRKLPMPKMDNRGKYVFDIAIL